MTAASDCFTAMGSLTDVEITGVRPSIIGVRRRQVYRGIRLLSYHRTLGPEPDLAGVV